MRIKYIGKIAGSTKNHIAQVDGTLTQVPVEYDDGYTIIHHEGVRVYLRTDDPAYCNVQTTVGWGTPYAVVTEAVNFAKKFKKILDQVAAK